MAETAIYYQIQVSRRENFSGEIVWDSGKCSMSPVADGERCHDIEYGGTGLALDGSKYYWRIRFWDDADNVSPWSTETAYFTMWSEEKEEEVVPPEREEPGGAEAVPIEPTAKVKRAVLPLLTRRRQLIWSRLITPPTRVILDP